MRLACSDQSVVVRLRGEAKDQGIIEQQISMTTYLVVDLVGVGSELNGLLENRAFLVELDAFGPVVKSASNVDFFGGMLPAMRIGASAKEALQRQVQKLVDGYNRKEKDRLAMLCNGG